MGTPHPHLKRDLPSLHDVAVSVRAGQCPADVRLVPENEPVKWMWEDEYVHLAVPRVNGHQIAQLVGAAG